MCLCGTHYACLRCAACARTCERRALRAHARGCFAHPVHARALAIVRSTRFAARARVRTIARSCYLVARARVPCARMRSCHARRAARCVMYARTPAQTLA